MTTASAPVRVVYIAGLGRSGSTLAGQLLGSAPESIYAGEVRYLWDRGIVEGGSCGCARPVRDCEVWGEVAAQVLAAFPDLSPEQLASYRRRTTKTRHLPLLLTGVGKRLLGRRLRGYLEVLDSLYSTLGEVSGAQVIVDSSSSPMYALVLALHPSLTIQVVHLIRDPRAHAFSWRRVREWGDPVHSEAMPRFNLLKSTLWWFVWNIIVEIALRDRVKSYLRIRYEDLMADPRPVLESIFHSLGLRSELNWHADDATQMVNLPVNHAVAGNPARFRIGWVRLQSDVAWKSEMGPVAKAAVTLLCWPLCLRYGYPI